MKKIMLMYKKKRNCHVSTLVISFIAANGIF